MKSASTLRESSLANSWFSKNSSSSVRIPTLYLRSEKSNIYSYFNLFKMKITAVLVALLSLKIGILKKVLHYLEYHQYTTP